MIRLGLAELVSLLRDLQYEADRVKNFPRIFMRTIADNAANLETYCAQLGLPVSLELLRRMKGYDPGDAGELEAGDLEAETVESEVEKFFDTFDIELAGRLFFFVEPTRQGLYL